MLKLINPFLCAAFCLLPSAGFCQDSLKVLCTVHLKYPKEAEEKNISGTVIVVFDVDSNCQRINLRVEKSVGYGCDEEALRVVAACNKALSASKIKCPQKKGLKQPVTFRNSEE